MSFPALTVEIAFQDDPLDTPAWTDVSDYVRSVSIRRGKHALYQQMQAGVAEVVVDNRDGRFDPANSGSPYAPHVLPMRPLRITATWDGDTYGLFRGFIEGLPLSYPGQGRDAVASITAVDGFKVMNLRTVERWFPEELSSARVSKILDAIDWPAGDRSITTGQTTVSGNPEVTWASVQTNAAAAPAFSVTLSRPAGIEAGDLLVALIAAETSSPSFSAVTSVPQGWQEVTTTHGNSATGSGPAVAAFWKLAQENEPATYEFGGIDPVDRRGTIARITGHDPAEPIPVSAVASSETNTTSLTVAALEAEREGLLIGAWAWGATGTITLPAGFTSQSSATADPPFRVGTKAVSAAGSTSSQQATCTANSKAAGLLLLVTTKPTVEGNPLAHLLTVADSELGLFYMDCNGAARFLSRHALIGGLLDTAEYTFSPTDRPFRDIALSFDDADLWNTVAVTSEGVGTSSKTDASSATTYGSRTLARTVLLTTAAEQEDHATFVLTGTAQPALRVDRLEPIGELDAGSHWPYLLDRDLGAKVLVQFDPPGAGDAISQASYVEGIAWAITPSRWQVAWNLVPLDRRADFWVLGDSMQSLLGSTTRLAF